MINSNSVVDDSVGSSLRILVPLAFFFSLGQFEIAISLPSLPAIARDFNATTNLLQYSITMAYVGFGLGQLIAGSVIDRLGRKSIALVGLAAFVLSTFCVMCTRTLSAFILLRTVQGFGCAGAVVAARTSARDFFDGAALARAIAIVNMASAVFSALGTILGGQLQDHFGWRSTFVVAALVGSIIFTAGLFAFPEKYQNTDGKLNAETIGYLSVVKSKVFVISMLTVILMEIGEFSFLVSSPIIFESQFHLSASQYGLIAPLILIAYSSGAAAVTVMSSKFQDLTIAFIGCGIGLLGAISALLFCSASEPLLVNITVAFMLFVFSAGVVISSGSTAALRPFKSNAGPASASLGFVLVLGIIGGSGLASLRLGFTPAFQSAFLIFAVAVLSIIAMAVIKISQTRKVIS